MRARFPGLPLPLHREPAGELAVHDVEAIRRHTVADSSLPGRLPRPEPGSLRDQRQASGIEPHMKVILGREGSFRWELSAESLSAMTPNLQPRSRLTTRPPC